MEIKLLIDDAQLESLVRRVLAEMRGDKVREDRQPRIWLANCSQPEDLLQVLESPDTSTPGIRSEPHWRVLQEVANGDLVVFRDPRRRALIGEATAERREVGEHRHKPGIVALRWWLRDPVRYATPVPDRQFIPLFRQHQQSDPGYPLLRHSGEFAQKGSLYPLDKPVRTAIDDLVGSSGANNAD